MRWTAAQRSEPAPANHKSKGEYECGCAQRHSRYQPTSHCADRASAGEGQYQDTDPQHQASQAGQGTRPRQRRTHDISQRESERCARADQ